MIIPAILLLVGTAVALAGLVALHVLPTGLNPLRDPVSQYGITRFRAGYAAAAGGAAIAGVGGALLFAAAPGAVAIATALLLAVFAVARALIAFFPMDAPGEAVSRTGRVHNVLAFAAFGPVTAAAFTGAGVLHDAGFAAASVTSTVCGAVMAGGAIGMLAARRRALRGAFGLFERLIYLGFLAWFGVLAVVALG